MCTMTKITVLEMNTHIHHDDSLKTQVMNTHVHSLDAHEIETNVMNIHILWIYMRCIYICILSVSCEQNCNFVSTRVCIPIVFFQVVPHSQCVWWLRPTHHASRRSICFSHHEYLDPFTLCLASHSHFATFSLAPCCVPRSHRVLIIYLAPLWSLANTV